MAVSRRSFLSLSTAAAGAGAGAGFALRPNSALALTSPAGALDVKQYGVMPGAAGDQSELLQQAINDAAGFGMPLFLPPGRYLVSGLTLPSNAMLVGVPGQTRLIFTGGSQMIYARDVANVALSGLTIGSAGNALTEEARALVHFKLVRGGTVENCALIGGNRTGIAFEEVSGRISACDISAMGQAAIFSLDGRGVEIVGNTVSDCRNNGILVWRSQAGEDGTLVSSNRISNIGAEAGGTGQNGNGISIFRAGDVTVTQNRISDCAFTAIRNNAGANCQIVSNSCARLGEVAIYAEFGFDGALIANNLIDDAAAGISITNFNDGGRLAVCSGNLVRNMTRKPPYFDGTNFSNFGIGAEADTVITGNVVENSAGSGLSLGWGPYLRDVMATSNIVRQAEIGIAVSVAPGAGAALVSDNMISKTTRGGIFGKAWREVVTGDLSVESSEEYSQLTVSRNRSS